MIYYLSEFKLFCQYRRKTVEWVNFTLFLTQKTRISDFDNFPDFKISHFEICFALMSSKVSIFLLPKKWPKIGSHGEKTVNFWIFLIKKKKWKTTFFFVSTHKQDFFKKHEKWPLASNRSTKRGSKKSE